ncbi:hypothetical protein HR12_23435 [Microbacterium sp. SUBG005]|nr:hypothetical protein HR12_23435 [Microbacterium sp. SUBG005]
MSQDSPASDEARLRSRLAALEEERRLHVMSLRDGGGFNPGVQEERDRLDAEVAAVRAQLGLEAEAHPTASGSIRWIILGIASVAVGLLAVLFALR